MIYVDPDNKYAQYSNDHGSYADLYKKLDRIICRSLFALLRISLGGSLYLLPGDFYLFLTVYFPSPLILANK